MKLLAVDDDPSTLALLKLHLVREGFSVETAAGAGPALARLAVSPFDWLLVDGQLGDGDGLELARLARSARPGLRTVMISGYYDGGDIAGAPIEAFFPKPLDTEALAAYLRGADAS